MSPLIIFVLAGAKMMVYCETHSLTYIYTGFSKPINLPGFHEFTAMGLLDNVMIDYYDSDGRNKVPKQSWMKDILDQEYWQTGTLSRLHKQDWFKTNIKTLIKRFRQNDTESHVLQWMHGCKGESQPDDSVKFVDGMYMFSYEGCDLLHFDLNNQVWVTTVHAARETTLKWNNVQIQKEHIKGYIKKKCIKFMHILSKGMQKRLKDYLPPVLYMFTRNSNMATKFLICLVTGFRAKDVVLRIKRNSRILTQMDGLESSGVRPNEDETFQRQDSVELLESDSAAYTCEFDHPASKTYIVKSLNTTARVNCGVMCIMIIVHCVIVGLIAAIVVTIVCRRSM